MHFVIIASPRTGSTHLTSLLNEQEGIACHGEIFHPKKVFVRWPGKHKTRHAMAALMKLREQDPQGFLDYISGNSGNCRLVGFKIFAGHNDAILDALIADNAVKKIVLWRPNLLASYSSSLIRGHNRTEPSESAQVRFDAERFAAYVERHGAFYRHVCDRLNAARQHFFVITYEQINDRWLLASLLNFIGGDSANLIVRSRKEKLNTAAIISRFSNSVEVVEFLRSRGLASWQYETQFSFDPFELHPGKSISE